MNLSQTARHNDSSKQFNAFIDFLYDYAVIAEGGSPKDPAKYLRQLDKYLS